MTTFRQYIVPLVFMLPITVQASYWSPHIGMDYKYWGVHPGEEYNYDKTYPRLNNAINVYVGTRINGYFGIDFGYENSLNKRRTAVYEGGELTFIPNEAFAEAANNSTMVDLRLHTLHGEMNFYWETSCGLEVIFILGMAYVYPDTHIMHLDASNGVWVEYENKSVPFWSSRAGMALQYNYLPCFGLKFSVISDQIRRLGYIGETDLGDYFEVHPYKRATSFMLGFVYSLSPPRR